MRIFTPFIIGNFIIVPEGHRLQATTQIPLIMGKKGAFGSGEHETTSSCLEFLATIPNLGGMRILDLGSGTGILAIAALKLGASTAVAIDICPQAAASCTANACLNGVDDRIFSVCGELSCLNGAGFDLLLANIYADLHLALADAMVNAVRPGGWLLLSGIPLQDKFEVQHCFTSRGCNLHDQQILEDYTTMLLRKA